MFRTLDVSLSGRFTPKTFRPVTGRFASVSGRFAPTPGAMYVSSLQWILSAHM